MMFASDYPHHEGTDDPIKRFEQTMSDVSEEIKQSFIPKTLKHYLVRIFKVQSFQLSHFSEFFTITSILTLFKNYPQSLLNEGLILLEFSSQARMFGFFLSFSDTLS